MKAAPTVRVGDIATQIRGVSYANDDASDVPFEGSLPILRANNVTDHGLTFEDLVYVPHTSIRQSQMLQLGDIVIATSSGSLGVVGKAAPLRADFQGSFGAFCKTLRPGNAVEPSYLAHFFATKDYRRRISALASGANINNLRNEHLDDLIIPLPPLEEQRRIAAILDKADALRQKRRLTLQNLDALTQSIFLDMFGDPATNPRRWPRVRFSELLKSIDSGSSPVCLDRRASEGEWGVLKLGAVTRCEYDESQQKALPDHVAPQLQLEVKPGDLLFTRKNTRELVAACALVYSTRPRLLLPDLIFRFVFKQDAPVSMEYLQQLLIYPSKRQGIQRLAGGSAGSMPNISKAKLLEIEIELPALDLQAQFSEQVKVIQKLKQKYLYAAQAQQLGFYALEHRAFRGEL